MSKDRKLTANAIAPGAFLVMVFLSGIATKASAQELESLANVAQTAERHALQLMQDFAVDNITVSAGSLDSRLRLKKCTAPLSAFSQSSFRLSPRVTVGVRCADGKNPWSLYVPVAIDATTDVVMATRALARNDSISADSVRVVQVPLSRTPPHYVSSLAEIEGMVLARAVGNNTPLTLSALRTRDDVHRGEDVTIIARGGGIQVHMAGEAMESGKSGDRIAVTNRSSGRRIEATILRQGVVAVSL